MKIRLTSSKNYTVKGWLFDDELTEKQLTKLGLEKKDQAQIVYLEGEYSVDWDDDIPMVAIEYLQLVNGDKILDLKESEYNYDTLCNEIEQESDSDWYADRMSDASDYYGSY